MKKSLFTIIAVTGITGSHLLSQEGTVRNSDPEKRGKAAAERAAREASRKFDSEGPGLYVPSTEKNQNARRSNKSATKGDPSLSDPRFVRKPKPQLTTLEYRRLTNAQLIEQYGEVQKIRARLFLAGHQATGKYSNLSKKEQQMLAEINKRGGYMKVIANQ